MIEELALLPVDFDRQMGAAVQVGMHPSPETHGEGRFAEAVAIHREAQAASAVDQFFASADQAPIQACCRNHAANCATLAAQ